MPLSDQEVVEKHVATFQCELSKPNCKVTWFRDGTEINIADTHYTISNEDYTYSLVIQDCNMDDTAEYTIRCDEASTTATLKVAGMLAYSRII